MMHGVARTIFVRSTLLAITSLLVLSIIWPSSAAAALLTPRSLSIGTSVPNATTNYNFTFSYASSNPIGSLQFEFCTTPFYDLPCNAPLGLDASGAVLASQSGEVGFTVLNAQTTNLVLTRVPTVPTQNPSQYVFSGVVNPSAVGTFFVRLGTFQSVDASGARTDSGSVVNSINQGVNISTEVPPILKFCVGLTLGDDCSTDSDSVVELGDLKTNAVASGSSQMIAATNAEFGLAIAVYGTSMTSGNNVIAPLASLTISAPGNAQFGLNVRKNTNPTVGQDPSGPGVVVPAARYDTPNRYAFASGDLVATSPVATDSRKITASYIVNVSPAQPPGVYTATLTYICTATF